MDNKKIIKYFIFVNENERMAVLMARNIEALIEFLSQFT